jgi:hypothetical protein
MSRKYTGQYRSTFTEANLISAATVVCTAGQFTRLGEYKVLSGDLIALGYGDLDDQCGAVGRIYMLLKDNTGTPVEMPGTVRLSLMSSADRQLSIEFECRTEIIDANATDRTKQLPLEVSQTWLSLDKRFELSFNPDTTGTLVKANSKILVDITKEAI